MKTTLKTILGLAVLGMTLLTTTAPTWAGKVNTSQVSITNTPTRRSAFGSMVGARYSADSLQAIGCITQSFEGDWWTTCFARDNAGQGLSCASTDVKFLDVVQGMTDSSYISFVVDLSTSRCADITVYHGSDLLK